MLRVTFVHRFSLLTKRSSERSELHKITCQKNIVINELSFKKTFCSSVQKNLNTKTVDNSVGSFVANKNVFRSPFEDIKIPSDYVHQYVWRNVDKWWNKTAIVCALTGRSYTYKELRKLCGKFATSLRRNNVLPGDTIAAVLPNVLEYPIVALGASEAGVQLTLVNPACTAFEMRKQIENSSAKTIITSNEKYPVCMESIKDLQNLIKLPIIIVPTGSDSVPSGTINFRDLLANNIEEFEKTGENIGINGENETIILPYSSGTTGLPKGVELTHRFQLHSKIRYRRPKVNRANIVANLCQLNHPEYTFAEAADGEKNQEVVPFFLPAYHIYGLVVCLKTYLSLGGKLIFMPQFTSTNLLQVFENHPITQLYLAPPVIQLMVNDDRFNKKHMTSCKSVTSGAAPVGIELVTKFHEKMGSNWKFTQGYGLTETSPVIARGKFQLSDGSVGLITVNTRIRIVSRESNEFCKNLGINDTGEILVEGPQVMKGYFNNLKATKECMDGEWFKTGDLGYVDDKGELFVTGRLKDLIKVKGYQVSPTELEDLIHGYEKVSDVAVIGVPDEKLGEIPKAFVVPKAGVKITEEEIKDFVAARVSNYKHLGHVSFIDQIPKSAAGKILKRELAQL